jgi:two-component system, cell cycle response regulator DivK
MRLISKMQDFATPSVVLALALVGTTALGMMFGFFLRGWLDARRRAKARVSQNDHPSTHATHARVEDRPASGIRSTPRPRTPVSVDGRTGGHPGWNEPEGPTVLLVDDRPELLALHGACLHKHGYRVLVAEDGLTGLEFARTHQPGVIVLDHSMPGRTGIDVAWDLKRDPETAHIPVLLMTAHSYGAVGAAARAAGCDAFLPKPVDPSRLLREVMVHMSPDLPRS